MKMKIRRFKNFFQVVNALGHTIEQFTSRGMAEEYIEIHSHSRLHAQQMGLECVSHRIGKYGR